VDRGPSADNLFRAALRGRGPRPLIIAHRGDSSHSPENTLEAARLGRDAGADAWEFDVQLARDGVPVVVHDESLARTTDVSRRFADDPRARDGWLVSDFDLDEIRLLDAGSWFLDPGGGPRSAAWFGTLGLLDDEVRARFASGEVRVPTLAEALELTDRLGWLANVELKSFPSTDHGLLEAVHDVIDATGTARRVLISSFDHADVALSIRLRPEIAAGVLSLAPLYRPEEYARAVVRADAYHPSSLALGSGSDAYRRRPSPQALRRDDIDALRGRGVAVLVFTVNDPSPDGLAAHLAEAGVDGLFTDDPGGLRGLFGPP
jgi:glycerophosphoryl diester phosphodiesterase